MSNIDPVTAILKRHGDEVVMLTPGALMSLIGTGRLDLPASESVALPLDEEDPLGRSG